MKQIEVQIMGQGYLLSCPDDGEAMLLQAVSRVDAAMCKIRDAGKVRARDRIAVLASLNLAFELSEALAKAEEQADMPQAPPDALPTADPTADDLLVRDLIHRVDAVLGANGQLL